MKKNNQTDIQYKDLRIGLRMVCKNTGEQAVIVAIADTVRVLHPERNCTFWYEHEQVLRHYRKDVV